MNLHELVCRCTLLLLALSCGADVTASTNPGLKVRVSQRGLDYAASIAVQIVSDEIRGMSLPDIKGSERIKVGKVDYEITNTKMTDFQQPTAKIIVSPQTGVTWSVTDATVSIHGNWRYSYRKFITFTDSGSFDATASGISVFVSTTLGMSSAGHVTMSATGCRSSVDRVRIRLRGGASWLYNLFAGKVEGPIRNGVREQICARALTAINVDAASQLAELQRNVVVGDGLWMIDYRLLAAPSVGEDYIETSHKGEFFYVDDRVEAPFRPGPLPSPASHADRMVALSISEYVFNTVGYALYRRGVLGANVTVDSLPAHRAVLQTSCQLVCIGNLLPVVGRLHPNAVVEIEIQTTSAPKFNIEGRHVVVSLGETLVVRARHADRTLVRLFGVEVQAKVAVAVRLDGLVVKGSIGSFEETLTLIDSDVGAVPMDVLVTLFDVAKSSFIVPEANKLLGDGFPPPSVDQVEFVDAAMDVGSGYLVIASDFKYNEIVAGRRAFDEVDAILRELYDY